MTSPLAALIETELKAGKSVLTVATELGVAVSMVRRISPLVNRGNKRKTIPPEKREAIRRMLRMQRRKEEIRKVLRCSGETVYSIEIEMRSKGEL